MFGRPVRIADGVFQLRALGARVTVLAKDGNAILVDSGLPGSSRIIMRGLRDCGIAYERISRIVVTHAHPDHSGGLAELAGGTGITVAVHEAEADIVEGIAPAPNPLRSRFLAALTRPAMSRLNGAPVRVDERLSDGDLVPFPAEVRIVHLPGHTPRKRWPPPAAERDNRRRRRPAVQVRLEALPAGPRRHRSPRHGDALAGEATLP